MKAMILAAGLGTRLRPLTDHRPKALVELNGRTLLEITITRLKSFGVTEIIINVHHFADMVIDYLQSHKNFNMRIEISLEEVLLDTGGGLKKASWFFLENSATNSSNSARINSQPALISSPPVPPAPENSVIPDEPFLLHNVDILSTIDLARMLQFHKQNQALATLAVQSRESSRQLLFNQHNQLVGRRAGPNQAPELVRPSPPPPAIPSSPHAVIPSPHPPVISSEARNLSSSPPPDGNPLENCHPERSEGSAFSPDSPLATRHSPLLQSLAFSGIHILSPRLLPLLTEEGIFSIIPAYLRLSAQNEKIQAFRADEYYWRDLGKPADLAQANLDLQQDVLPY
jgi:NDP-sugar pyrophosphorylase family protein